MSTSVSRKRRNRGERGQIVVIFAGAVIAFVALCAIVIDVSWYWSNTLRMQRAADAAALAGVVFLPGNEALAISTARAEATKNGYTSGVNGITVTPFKDPQNSRRLHVIVSGGVNTYFARVVGLNSLNASRESKADFVLPVPMGSPQNYYGVSALKGTTVSSTPSHDTTGTGNSTLRVATTAPGGTPWTSNTGTVITAVNGDESPNTTAYARTAANNATQQYGNFGLLSQLAANQTVDTVDGIQVVLTDAYLSATCSSTVNTINVQLSWDNGANWTTLAAANKTASLPTTAATAIDTTLGSATSVAAWAGNPGGWIGTELSDTKFRVRLTAAKACGTAGTELRLDKLEVRVYYHTDTVTTVYAVNDDPTARVVPDPGTGSALSSQGFWGAVITKGGDRGNGDRFSPDSNGAAANLEYDGLGYDYTVEVGASGKVSIYDPTFCATGPNTSGGSYGTGDHWIGGSGAVTTVFTLYNINNTPLDLTDDISVASSGSLFADEVGGDYSGNYGKPAGFTNPGVVPGGYTNCATNPYHNAWWAMANALPAGKYRLNVNTSNAANDSTNAENMWSVWVSGGSKPRIYGGGKMAGYNNLDAGVQQFYLAQIDAVHAGKTMVIELFDPGDVNTGASLRILSPDGNAYNYATFSYTSDNGQPPGNNVTTIVANSGGTSYFNNSIITILIPLPSTYGDAGLTPPGETEAGWWKIEYTVGGGNDTTTWAVSIRGNPVHLVLP